MDDQITGEFRFVCDCGCRGYAVDCYTKTQAEDFMRKVGWRKLGETHRRRWKCPTCSGTHVVAEVLAHG